MKQPKFFIGIDFGHGETSVSRVPGINGQEVSRIPLRTSGNFMEQKVYSAICKNDNGNWQFVRSEEDFSKPDLREGNKERHCANLQNSCLIQFYNMILTLNIILRRVRPILLYASQILLTGAGKPHISRQIIWISIGHSPIYFLPKCASMNRMPHFIQNFQCTGLKTPYWSSI